MTSAQPRPAPIAALLVDDSAFARNTAQRVLLGAGISSVQQAASGREAIEILSRPEAAIDIVFCDLMMPDMDGIQITRHLADLAVAPAVVFLSGADPALLGAAVDTGLARALRVLGGVQKPLTLDAARRILARLEEVPAARRSGRAAEIALEALDAALAQHQFVLHYQPKVLLPNGSVSGFESLARWSHPERGLLFPDTFIPLAERSGRIGLLTEQVTTLALQQCAAWHAMGLHPKVSINLSAFSLVDLDLPDRLAREAECFGVDPRQLILEITESGLFHDTANSLDILARLRMKGFALSIDDFGTGYSSMDQLRHVPFAEMKIDRAFVNRAAQTPRARAILESSVNLGHSLRMSVVAEGVETQEDWDAVRTAGVDLAQGYFIARPMPAEAVPAWLALWADRHARRG